MCHNVSRVLWRDGLSSASSFRRSVLAAWTSAACHEAARSGVKRSEWRARPGSAFFATASSMASALIATNVEKCRKRIKDYQRLSKIIKVSKRTDPSFGRCRFQIVLPCSKHHVHHRTRQDWWWSESWKVEQTFWEGYAWHADMPLMWNPRLQNSQPCQVQTKLDAVTCMAFPSCISDSSFSLQGDHLDKGPFSFDFWSTQSPSAGCTDEPACNLPACP